MLDLVLEGLFARFGARSFRYDATLSGPSIVAITGPSGAGKSTLFHLLAGFETPLSGSIVMDGRDITQMQPAARPMTYVFQDHNLFAHLSIFDNVALGASPSLRLTAEQKRRASNALEEVGLAGFEKRMPRDLSGGERQRVAFARALLRQLPLLLLDEPFASLDAALREEMGGMVVAMKRLRPMIVLMITHDRAEISRLADRVVEIRDGRIIFAGPPTSWEEFGNSPIQGPSGLKFD